MCFEKLREFFGPPSIAPEEYQAPDILTQVLSPKKSLAWVGGCIAILLLAGATISSYYFWPDAKILLDRGIYLLTEESLVLYQGGLFMTLPIVGGLTIIAVVHGIVKRRESAIHSKRLNHKQEQIAKECGVWCLPKDCSKLLKVSGIAFMALCAVGSLCVGTLYFSSIVRQWVTSQALPWVIQIISIPLPVWQTTLIFGGGPLLLGGAAFGISILVQRYQMHEKVRAARAKLEPHITREDVVV